MRRISMVVVLVGALAQIGHAEPAASTPPRPQVIDPWQHERGRGGNGIYFETAAVVGYWQRPFYRDGIALRLACGWLERGPGALDLRLGLAVDLGYSRSADGGANAIGAEASVDYPIGRYIRVGPRAALATGDGRTWTAGVRARYSVLALGVDAVWTYPRNTREYRLAIGDSPPRMVMFSIGSGGRPGAYAAVGATVAGVVLGLGAALLLGGL